MDFFTSADIQSSIRSIEELFGTGIFERANSRSPFVRSAFIEVIVCLRDLMAKCERFSTRVAFTDDVIITDDVKDVSDAIKAVRDAICHLESEHHFVTPKVKASFNVVYGKTGPTMLIGGQAFMASDYDDETAFFFGVHRLYLRRHIVRAFEEAKARLLPLIAQQYTVLSRDGLVPPPAGS